MLLLSFFFRCFLRHAAASVTPLRLMLRQAIRDIFVAAADAAICRLIIFHSLLSATLMLQRHAMLTRAAIAAGCCCLIRLLLPYARCCYLLLPRHIDFGCFRYYAPLHACAMLFIAIRCCRHYALPYAMLH